MDGSPIPDEELARIEASLVGTTPGPWHVSYPDNGDALLMVGEHLEVWWCEMEECCGQCLHDLEFAAIARDAVPRLLEEVRRLRARESTVSLTVRHFMTPSMLPACDGVLMEPRSGHLVLTPVLEDVDCPECKQARYFKARWQEAYGV
jgi:hypothetical protein